MLNQAKTLTLAFALLALAACEDSTRSLGLDERPPASLTQECAEPFSLPNRDAQQAEVEQWWLADRFNLVECGSSHKGLVDWVLSHFEE